MQLTAAPDAAEAAAEGPETAEGFADGSVFHIDQARAYATSFAIGRLGKTA